MFLGRLDPIFMGRSDILIFGLRLFQFSVRGSCFDLSDYLDVSSLALQLFCFSRIYGSNNAQFRLSMHAKLIV